MTLAAKTDAAGILEPPAVTPKQSDNAIHLLTPTLVIACGRIPDDDVKAIQDNVAQRIGAALDPDERRALGFTVPADIIRWERIETSVQATKDTIERFAAPFSEQGYVESMVARGILPDVPTQEKPLHVQIIALYENGTDSDSAKLLEALADQVPKVFEHNATFSLVLIAIGKLDPALQNEALYWPRFRLQTRTFGGMVATRERIIEVCQNLIIALVSSELVRVIDSIVDQEKQSVRWIWIGGSALVSDVANMYEYVRLSAPQELIGLLLKDKLTPDGQRWIDNWLQQEIQVLQNKARTTALSVAGVQGWDIKPKAAPPDLATVLRRKIYDFFLSRFGWNLRFLKDKEERLPLPLMPGGELKEKIANPDENLPVFLLKCYKLLRDGLEDERTVRAIVQKEYRELLKNISMLIRPPQPANTILHMAVPSDQTALRTSKSEEPVQPLGPFKPGGLAAVTYATAQAASILAKSPDVPVRDITIHRTKSDHYLAAVTLADADSARAAYRRWFRYQRSLLSSWGYLFSLIPVWPLLVAPLVNFLNWDVSLTAVYTALLLFLVGVSAHIYFKGRVEARRKALQEEQERLIALSALGNLTRVLRDYRLMLIAHLQASASTLTDLRDLSDEMESGYRERLVELRKLFALDWYESATYRLADMELCEQWVGRAKKKAEGAEAFREIIVEEVFRRSRQASRSLLNRIVTQASEWSLEGFIPGELQPYFLAGRKEALSNGEHWRWLYQRAQPMGVSRTMNGKPFTVITVANEAAFIGETGKVPFDYKKVASQQNHELGCIRGIVEYQIAGE